GDCRARVHARRVLGTLRGGLRGADAGEALEWRLAEFPTFFAAVGPQGDHEEGDTITRKVEPVGAHALAGGRADGVPSQLTEEVERQVGRDALDEVRQELLWKEQAGCECGGQVDEVDHSNGGVRSRQVTDREPEGDERQGAQEHSGGERNPGRRIEPYAAGEVGERKEDGQREGGEHDRRYALGE